VRISQFGVVKRSSAEKRQKWLHEATKLGAAAR